MALSPVRVACLALTRPSFSSPATRGPVLRRQGVLDDLWANARFPAKGLSRTITRPTARPIADMCIILTCTPKRFAVSRPLIKEAATTKRRRMIQKSSGMLRVAAESRPTWRFRSATYTSTGQRDSQIARERFQPDFPGSSERRARDRQDFFAQSATEKRAASLSAATHPGRHSARRSRALASPRGPVEPPARQVLDRDGRWWSPRTSLPYRSPRG